MLEQSKQHGFYLSMLGIDAQHLEKHSSVKTSTWLGGGKRKTRRVCCLVMNIKCLFCCQLLNEEDCSLEGGRILEEHSMHAIFGPSLIYSCMRECALFE